MMLSVGLSKDCITVYGSTPPLPYTDSYFPFAERVDLALLGGFWCHISLLVPRVSYFTV